MKPLSHSITSLQRSGIREVMDLAFQHPEVLRLEVGDPDFPTPAHIVAAAAEAAPRYTPSRGLAEVREALAAKLTVFNGIPADAADVVVTAGGGHGLFSVYRGLTDPGDAALIPDPGCRTTAPSPRCPGWSPCRTRSRGRPASSPTKNGWNDWWRPPPASRRSCHQPLQPDGRGLAPGGAASGGGCLQPP